jgi:hypothetical protein
MGTIGNVWYVTVAWIELDELFSGQSAHCGAVLQLGSLEPALVRSAMQAEYGWVAVIPDLYGVQPVTPTMFGSPLSSLRAALHTVAVEDGLAAEIAAARAAFCVQMAAYA